MKKITVIVPMYNEEEMISLFFEKVNQVLEGITAYQTEILCVNDGSKDKTLELLKKQREIQNNLHIVSFSRNFGHEAGVAAGLEHATGDIVIVMDADLQDPPELIPELIKKYEEGYEVVNAKRVNRKQDSFLKRFTAETFYKVVAKMSGKVKIPQNVGNYRLMTRRVVDHVNQLREKTRVFRVAVPFVGFKTTSVEFTRPKRPKGESHYSYKSMFHLAENSIISSSNVPLKWSLKFGLVTGFLFLISSIIFTILYFVDKSNVLTYLPLMLISYLFLAVAIIVTFIGIHGMYLGRIFTEVQDRPLFEVEEEITSSR